MTSPVLENIQLWPVLPLGSLPLWHQERRDVSKIAKGEFFHVFLGVATTAINSVYGSFPLHINWINK
jgi:hypothetical protein